MKEKMINRFVSKLGLSREEAENLYEKLSQMTSFRWPLTVLEAEILLARSEHESEHSVGSDLER